MQPKPTSFVPPIVAALSSLVLPGLGQILARRGTRGFLILFSILSLYGLAAWRVSDAGVESLDRLSKSQQAAVGYAVFAIGFTLLGHLWNIYDAYACAEGKPTPTRLPGFFIFMAMLLIGSHITEVDVGKAIREVGDVQPRLVQMLWPWDDIWERDIENFDGVANWETPCDDTPPSLVTPDDDAPRLTVEPTCGQGSGPRNPDGSRQDGTLIMLQGEGFRPNEEARVYVQPPGIPAFQPRVDSLLLNVTPDDDGRFTIQFPVPNLNLASPENTANVRLIVRQQQEVGSLRLNEDFWLAFEGIIVTLFLAFMATAGGVVLSVPLSFLAARNLMAGNWFTYAVYYIVRLVLNVIRSIEPIIWALIAIIWVGPGPFAGTLALFIHTIASLGKLYSEAIESIDPGPIEALQATGANRLQTIMYAVVPQVVPPFVSFTIYRWDINVRMSTIIGAVGGGGIGFILVQWIRISDYDAVGIAVWMIAIVVTVLDYASARIRERYI